MDLISPLEIGREYVIKHSRKGVFRAKLVADRGEFLEVEITGGEAHRASGANSIVGETVIVNRRLCTFRELPNSDTPSEPRG